MSRSTQQLIASPSSTPARAPAHAQSPTHHAAATNHANQGFLAELERQIAQRQSELEALVKARDVLLGQPHQAVQVGHARSSAIPSSGGAPATVADAVELVLLETPQARAHADHLVGVLATRYQIRLSRKNLLNTLNRWVGRKRRFARVAPNTFALLGGA